VPSTNINDVDSVNQSVKKGPEVYKGKENTFTLKDDDIVIRTKFVNRSPETYIEREYAPTYGGNTYIEENKANYDCPVNVKDACVAQPIPRQGCYYGPGYGYMY
jgi:hypothetical protein